MHRIALITLAALLTTACASSKRVVVDKQGIDEAQYQQDLSDCRAIADEVFTRAFEDLSREDVATRRRR